MQDNRGFIHSNEERRYAHLNRVILLIFLILCMVGVSLLFGDVGKKGVAAKKSVRFDIAYIPFQSELTTAEPVTFTSPDYTWRIYPRAGYEIAARVLQSTTYDDWQAGISPVDLALGWGVMSDPAIDKWVEVRQENRWYFYQKRKDAPLSLEDIRISSANVHIIPANEMVAALIQELRPNDMVMMKGQLVDVEVERLGEQIRFQTSLTRSDSDDNSCEIFYVERVTVETAENLRLK